MSATAFRPPLRVLVEDDLSPAGQMARDEQLLCAPPAGPLIRFYRWDPPTLSVGRNQRSAGLVDESAIAARGWQVVRRPTGGGAVLHLGETSFSLLLPADPFSGPKAAYTTVKEILSDMMEFLGLSPDIIDYPGNTHMRQGEICFQGGHRDELFSEGRKMAGISLRWSSSVVLAQISLLLTDNADELAGCICTNTGRDARAFARRLRAGLLPLGELLSPLPPVGELRAAATAAFLDSSSRFEG